MPSAMGGADRDTFAGIAPRPLPPGKVSPRERASQKGVKRGGKGGKAEGKRKKGGKRERRAFWKCSQPGHFAASCKEWL